MIELFQKYINFKGTAFIKLCTEESS